MTTKSVKRKAAKAKKAAKRPYVIVRCYRAGVHAGELAYCQPEGEKFLREATPWRA